MSARGKYKSKHYEEILSCLQTMPGEHFTINELHIKLKERGLAIGETTVYRQLNRMLEEGLVSKYTIEVNAPACYEYAGERQMQELAECYHCKCETCGKLIHLHCSEIEGLKEHLLREHQFRINPFRTVFYGICEECLARAAAGGPKHASGGAARIQIVPEDKENA